MQRLLKAKNFIRSFYSSELYREVFNNWKGMGFKYLLGLSALVYLYCLVIFLYIISNIHPSQIARNTASFLFEDAGLPFEENANRILDMISQAPELEIKNGIVSSNVAQPYFITDRLTKRPFIIIDTTGHYNSIGDSKAVYIITRNSLISAGEKGSEDVMPFSTMKDSEINEEDLNNFFHITEQIPKIELAKGEALIADDIKMPYDIKTNSGKLIALIDTSGKDYQPENGDAYFFLLKDKFIYKNFKTGKYDQVMLSQLNTEFMYNSILTAINTAKSYIIKFALLLAPLFILTFFIILISFAMFGGMIAYIIASIMKMKNPSYEDMVRLSAVAITPVVIINILLPQLIASQGVIYFIIMCSYIYYAVRVNSQNPNKNTIS